MGKSKKNRKKKIAKHKKSIKKSFESDSDSFSYFSSSEISTGSEVTLSTNNISSQFEKNAALDEVLTEENKELKKCINEYEKYLEKFNKGKFLKELKSKFDGGQYFKKAHYGDINNIKDYIKNLRIDYQEHRSEDEDSLYFYIIIDKLKEYCDEKKDKLVKKYEKNIKKARENFRLNPQYNAQIWVRPQEGHLFYSGLNKKRVTIPYYKVHKKLIHASHSFKNKLGKDANNYVFSHILFIVSDGPYEKKNYRSRGRTYIDFPIVCNKDESSLMVSDKRPPSNNYLISVGKKSSKKSIHSEDALISQLNKNIKKIVTSLQTKMKANFRLDDNPEDFKVYQIVLFLDSDHTVCKNCEDNLYNKIINGEFIKKLTKTLTEAGFKTRRKKGKGSYIKILISTTSEEPYGNFNTRRRLQANTCTKEHYDDTSNSSNSSLFSANKETYGYAIDNQPIDLRKLPSMIISNSRFSFFNSSSSSSSDEKDNQGDQESLPLYTRFCSKREFIIRKYEQESEETVKFLPPHSFCDEESELSATSRSSSYSLT